MEFKAGFEFDRQQSRLILARNKPTFANTGSKACFVPDNPELHPTVAVWRGSIQPPARQSAACAVLFCSIFWFRSK
jgi:hypothetical protein